MLAPPCSGAWLPGLVYFICPGRNEEAFASESFLSFGTPDHQEAPHYPTHNFDVDLWIDL